MKFFHLSIIVLLSANLHAQFSDLQIVSEQITEPISALTDVDNDGDLDALNIARGVSTLTVYLNDGNGNMTPSQVIADSFYYRTHIVLGDIDNDGWEDLITIVYDNGYKLALYRNNMGVYSASEILFTFQYASFQARICLTNKNSDQYPEIAIAYDFGTLSILDNVAGVFQPATTIFGNFDIGAGYGETLQSIDMDNDGDEDLLSSRDASNSFKYWFENTAGTYTAIPYLNNSSNASSRTIMVDLNNDSLPDYIKLYTQNISPSSIYWWDNATPPYISGVPNSFPDGPVLLSSQGLKIELESDFTAIDLNADGYVDIVGNSDDQIYGLINDGNNNFTIDTIYIDNSVTGVANPYEEFHYSFGDINSDGHLDLLVSNKYEDDLFWLEHDGQLNFVQHLIRYNASTPIQIHAFDVNQDGSLDLISNYGRKRGVHLFESVGALDYKLNVPLDNSENIPYLNFGHQEIDFDDDGDLDLLYSEESGVFLTTTINWFENDPITQLSVYHEIPAGFQFRIVKAGDIDNDGLKDLVFVTTASELGVKYNLGGGNYGPFQLINSGAIANFIIEDMNGDQLNDFVVRVPNPPSGPTSTANGLAIIENSGGQTFLPMSNPLVSIANGNDSKFAVKDLNGDGLKDFIYNASLFQSNWAENLGNSAFGPQQTIASTFSYSPIAFFPYDVDSDGDADVIIPFEANNTYNGLNDIRWFENDGTGVFYEHQIGSNIIDINDIDFDDLDGDGDIDILIAADEDIIGFYRNDFVYPNQIYGSIFIDLDTNGIHDINEPGLDFASSELSPVAVTSFANIESEFFFAVDTGDYVLSYSNVDTVIWQRTTDSLIYHVSVDSVNSNAGPYDFGFFPQIDSTSLFVDLASNTIGCNQNMLQHLTVRNIGGSFPKAVIKYEHDPQIIIDSIIPMPDSVVNNSIYWSFDSLFFFEEFTPIIELTTPDFNSIGDTLAFNLSVTTIDSLGSDEYLFQDGFVAVLTCAYDPNNKLAETEGYLDPGFILTTEEFIDYTINFQNTGTDTAFNIKITDALSNNLDWSTLQILSSSHLVNTSINSAGVIDFNFPNINLPDSGASYINSMGYVKFRIDLKENLLPSSEIKNKASIYFDQNPPIITNETLHTIFDCSWLAGVSSDSNTLCVQNVAQLDYLGNFYETVQWSLDGNMLDDSPSLMYQFTTDSTYEIVLSAQNPMCVYDTTFYVSIGESPTFSLDTLSSLSICEGDSLEITASSQISWLSNSTQVEVIDSVFTVWQTDQVYLSLGIGSCFSLDTLSITSIALPIASISSVDTTICLGDSLLLYSNSIDGNTWYSNGQVLSISDTLIASQAGTIELQIEDTYGCVSEFDSLTLTTDNIDPIIVTSQNGTTICETDSTLLSVGANTNVEWYFGGLSISPSDSVYAGEVGWYTVEVSDTACPNQLDSVFIDLETLPSISITSTDTAFCPGDSVFLSSTGSTNYSWIYNSSIISNSQNIYVNESGVYFVEAFGTLCPSVTDSLSITELINPASTINYTYHQLEFVTQNAVNYEWYLDGNLLSGENDSVLTDPTDGHYIMFVTYDNSCSDSVEYTLNVSGVDEAMIDLPSTYPNPVSSYVILKWGTNTDITNASIRDINGRIVSKVQRVNEDFTQVDIDHFASGVYFVEFSGKSSRMVNCKIVKY